MKQEGHGYALLHRIVRKFFPGSPKGWYWGTITVYDSVDNLYRIEYEDEDTEEMSLEELLVILRSEPSIPKNGIKRKQNLKCSE